MEMLSTYTNSKLLFKILSIGLVFIISYLASLFVQSIVNDRIIYQEIALEGQAGEVSQVLIHNKLPGFDNETGVSVYRPLDRILKYAILFITLTFMTFFLTEVFYHLKLHPIQYLLVGLGLAEFYLLLLALMEHIGFLWAYIFATLMTISLISLYSRFILKTKKGGAFMAIMLTVIYSYLLVVLHLETYALLSGSLLLFTVLAVVMYVTRNLDWYSTFQNT
jgi:inner membrane protein